VLAKALTKMPSTSLACVSSQHPDQTEKPAHLQGHKLAWFWFRSRFFEGPGDTARPELQKIQLNLREPTDNGGRQSTCYQAHSILSM
jgi:hypothetical protein